MRIGNIVVEAHFTTKGNYRYGFKVGRTDESGALNVSYADIEKERRSNAGENLMDYNTLEDCDPTIEISPLLGRSRAIPSPKQAATDKIASHCRIVHGVSAPKEWRMRSL